MPSRGTPTGAPSAYDWIRQFGSPGSARAADIAVEGDTLYVVGGVGGADGAGHPLPGQTTAGNADAFIRAYRDDGTELWTRQFGSEDREVAAAVAVHSSGIYVAGEVGGDYWNNPNASLDSFLRKFSVDGVELWAVQGDDEALVNSIAVDDSGVYVAGNVTPTPPGQTSVDLTDAYLRKYDHDGQELWTRQFGTEWTDRGSGVAVDESGVYVAGAWGEWTESEEVQHGDGFVRKYTPDGEEVWTQLSGIQGSDHVLGIASDGSALYVTGYIRDPPARLIEMLRKYDQNGTDLWTNLFELARQEFPVPIETDGASAFMAGYSGGDTPPPELRTVPSDGVGGANQPFELGDSFWVTAIAVTDSAIFMVGVTYVTLPGQSSAGSINDAVVIRMRREPVP